MLHRISGPRRGLLLLAAVALFSGCHGGSSGVLFPHGPAGGSSPTPSPGSTGTLTAAQVNASMQNVQSMFAGMPHTDLTSDLNTLAAQMVSSGAYEAAVVNPGGITGTLPDGSTALFFADVPQDVGYATSGAARAPAQHSTTSAAARRPSTAAVHPQSQGRLPGDLSQPATNAVAFLVNTVDGAFNPPLQQTAESVFGTAFGNAAGYGTSDLDISLIDIIALGGSQKLDFLVINTHGMVIGVPPNLDYAMSTTTDVNDADTALYKSDIDTSLFYSVTLTIKKAPFVLAQYAFTPTFLAKHVSFNPGAIVYSSTCYGANDLIVNAVAATYKTANAGRYFSWSKAVFNTPADQSEAFLIQRLLGDSPNITGLGTYVLQNFPPQRPFPLDDVEAAMKAETRNSPILVSTDTYDTSDSSYAPNSNAPPTGSTRTNLVMKDLGGESVANPPIEYGFPAIERMAVTAESAAGGTLNIMGRFPSTPGTVTITDASGTTTLPVVNWTTSSITVTLPASGNGSSGQVTVVGSGLTSNKVPLTQWKGSFAYSESDTLDTMAGHAGGGTGTFQATFNVDFRADVHPFVPTIDATPAPQNLYFPQVEYDSTGTATALGGGFTDGDGDAVTFSLAPAAPVMQPAYPPLPGSSFAMGATPPPAVAACNSGLPGPQTTGSTAFCPGFGFNAAGVGACADDPANKNTLCFDATFGLIAATGGSKTTGGVVMLTMDPATYAIAVSAVPASTTTDHFTPGAEHQATAQLTGSFSSPLSPPNDDTPAARRRAASARH